jgi:hypothetical protein
VTIYHPTSHFIRCLPPLLSENNFQLTSFDDKFVHFRPGLTCHFRSGIFNERKAFWLLGMKVSWDVHVSNDSNPSKSILQVQRLNIRGKVSDQERHAGWTFLTTTTFASATPWRPVERWSTTCVGVVRPVAIVVIWRTKAVPVTITRAQIFKKGER